MHKRGIGDVGIGDVLHYFNIFFQAGKLTGYQANRLSGWQANRLAG